MTTFCNLTHAIRSWTEQDPELIYRRAAEVLLERIAEGDDFAVQTAQELFEGRLTFGTAGIRGPMQMGPRGMNRLVVAQTVKGITHFLWETQKKEFTRAPQVVIGFDGRRHSQTFALDAAKILSGHSIDALLARQMLPTPVLAFAVRKLGASAGLMFTASHNAATDNGCKVFLGGEHMGSQIISPVDSEIEALIQDVAETVSWHEIERSTTQVSFLEDHVLSDYISETLAALELPRLGRRQVEVVYTAMHGVGGPPFLKMMKKAGFTRPSVVREQFDPDPDFATVASPNPEETGSLDMSLDMARAVKADLIIAHDPDADRLAVALPEKLARGNYQTLTGNQVGAIFGWFLAEKAHASHQEGSLANSLVSSPVLERIAHHFGLDHVETLTGFKHISRVKNLIFGFEEALGYLVTPEVVRDKDGLSAGLLMVSIANILALEGRTLWDYLDDIEKAVGFFSSGQVTARLEPGVAGSHLTSSLRKQDLERIGPRKVIQVDDFLEGFEKSPPADILRYRLADGSRVIARPSGTEPKVKFYIDTEGESSLEANSRRDEIKSHVLQLISST